jgi:hypothetical protein
VAAHTASGHVVIDGQSMNGQSPFQRGGELSDGNKALVIKANSVSGNVVVLRAANDQGTDSEVQDTVADHDIVADQDTPSTVQDTVFPDAENAG